MIRIRENFKVETMNKKSFTQRIAFILLLSIPTLFASILASLPPIEHIQIMSGNRTYYFNNRETRERYAGITRKIDEVVLRKNVNTENKMGFPDKKIFIQSILSRVIIHGNESRYEAHGIQSTDRRFKHFEIIRLAESFAAALLAQSECGFMDCGTLKGYSNLYSFSGISKDTYQEWFNEMLETHNGGLYKRMISRIDGLRDLPTRSAHNDSQNVIFGNIPVHGIAQRQIPFISTYDMTAYYGKGVYRAGSLGILVKFRSTANHTSYIHIENPYFDTENRSPYTLRLHPVVHPNANEHTDINTGVDSQIIAGKNKTTTIGINDHDKSVQTHGGTFSPNNKHLTGLPRRTLQNDETYSFISKNTWERKRVDVFHLLTNSNEYRYLFTDSQNNFYSDFYMFLKYLTRHAYTQGTWPYYKPHLHKMMAFIEGRFD